MSSSGMSVEYILHIHIQKIDEKQNEKTE
jgi:hypothetical protein